MHAAIRLEALVKKLRDLGVPELLIAEVRSFYKDSYREAYNEGKCDCEADQADRDNDNA